MSDLQRSDKIAIIVLAMTFTTIVTVAALVTLFRDQHSGPNRSFETKIVANPTLPDGKTTHGGQGELDKGCAVGQVDRNSDLCAQWTAADAARDAAQWAYWQMLTGLWGVVLGAVTMCAAVAAALYARKAADETGRGASASEAAVKVATATGQAQVRAYISIVETWCIVDAQTKTVETTVKLKNLGNSPALHIRLFYPRIAICPWVQSSLREPSVYPTFEDVVEEDYDNLASNAELSFKSLHSNLPLTDEEFDPILRRGYPPSFFTIMEVRFRDVFGIEHVLKQSRSALLVEPDKHLPFNRVPFHPLSWKVDRENEAIAN